MTDEKTCGTVEFIELAWKKASDKDKERFIAEGRMLLNKYPPEEEFENPGHKGSFYFGGQFFDVTATVDGEEETLEMRKVAQPMATMDIDRLWFDLAFMKFSVLVHKSKLARCFTTEEVPCALTESCIKNSVNLLRLIEKKSKEHELKEVDRAYA